MKTKNLSIGLVIALAILFGVWIGKGNMADNKMKKPAIDNAQSSVAQPTVTTSSTTTATATATVKEFSMTSYFEMTGGKPSAHFSLKDINVNQGDKVRIKVTNTKGVHNFVIDELGIKQETPLDKEVTIEFTAEKNGDFVYYCSMPNHRAMGQWGTLHVTK